MTNKSIVKMALVAFSLVLMFSFGTHAQTIDCTRATDAEITDAIIAKITVKYKSQMSHIYVNFKDGEVTLRGWVTKKSIKMDIEKIVKKIKCVKKVVNNLTIGVGGGCAPGQKPCNGTCIPIEEDCPAKTKGT